MYPEYKNISLSFPLFSNHQQQSPLPALQLSSSSTNTNTGTAEESSSAVVLTGPQKMAQVFNVRYLGKLPMDPSVLSCGESGSGLLEAYPNTVAAKYLSHIVDSLVSFCDERVSVSEASQQTSSSMITDS